MTQCQSDHRDPDRPFIGLAEIFPSGAWEIDRRTINRPDWLCEYRDYQRRTIGSHVFLFDPARTCDEVREILFRCMRRLGIEPADTVTPVNLQARKGKS